MALPGLIVCDIDGTLVNSEKQVSGENREAIREYRERGGMFSLATGRIEKSVNRFCRELNLDVPMILYNGARIVHPVTGEVILDRLLSREDVERTEALLETIPLEPIFFIRGEGYVRRVTPAIETYQKGDGFLCRVLGPEEKPAELPVTKILMIGHESHFGPFREGFARDPRCTAALVQSEVNFLEVLPEGTNKGNALKVLAAHLGLKLDQTAAFGDNPNDLEMIETAGLGVAMANGHESLKALADRIAPSHNDHGVAVVIRELLEGE